MKKSAEEIIHDLLDLLTHMSEEEIESLNIMAKETLVENNRISVRIPERDRLSSSPASLRYIHG